jgi:endonuclease YncB( thermonuclease family)
MALLILLAAACSSVGGGSAGGGVPSGGQTAQVVHIVDGDTIDVEFDGLRHRIRYVGMNTPESNEPCFAEATAANVALVANKTVTLVKDVSETDQYGRLLRYVYVGDVFVNAELVKEGYAEVVSYPPDTAQFEYFKQLEQQAHDANIGCHPTGIFNDGSYTR